MVKCCFNELVLLNYLFTPRARVAKHVQNRVLFNFCVKSNTLKMAATKKTCGRVWENQETLLLLQKWGDENIEMKLMSCTRKRPI